MGSSIAILRLYFKLKVYQTSGMEFQVFFSTIMNHLDSDFVPIKPHGKWGDGGNDGCNAKLKHYYQIYAPLASTTTSPINEFKKAETDYGKLIKKWGKVNGYFFVLNDKFTNVPAPLQLDFQNFIENNKIPEGRIICSLQLQKLFMKLDDDTKFDVLGMYYIDENSTSDFEPSIVGELINYLLDNNDNIFNFLKGDAPNFDEKIVFNNLSPFLAARLISNYAEVYKIDDFLEIQGEELAQSLSITINKIYKEINSTIPKEETDRSSLIYFALIEALIPKFANKDKVSKRSYTSLAEVIIAKYFSTCDVYEDPNSPSTP
ncbi:ABC-three component system protein [Acinetobacter pittii]|uniref:ABC-three component system protein n=1 Tax=Acinetobacter pittii TaxID=48296 RepID=UPI001EE55F5D|nr:ABC-three component system protein [Acinetobacter pittii]MCG5225697.1 hypothetical protein [Acinetobacter pittii]